MMFQLEILSVNTFPEIPRRVPIAKAESDTSFAGNGGLDAIVEGGQISVSLAPRECPVAPKS